MVHGLGPRRERRLRAKGDARSGPGVYMVPRPGPLWASRRPGPQDSRPNHPSPRASPRRAAPSTRRDRTQGGNGEGGRLGARQ